MAKPTENPDWAESGANISDPTALRTEGYPTNHVPASAEANWLQRMAGRWIRYFEDFASGFTNVSAFVDDSPAVGATAMITPDEIVDLAVEGASFDTLDSNAEAIASDGRHLYVVEGDNVTNDKQVTVYEKESPHTQVAVLSFTGGPTTPDIRRVVTTGEFTAVAYDFRVELFDSDFNSVWLYNHGAVVEDCAINHDRVFLVGGNGTDPGDGTTPNVRAVSIDGNSGSLAVADQDWSAEHGNDLFAVAASGKICHVAGGIGTGNTWYRSFEQDTGNPLVSKSQVDHEGTRGGLAVRGKHVYAVVDIDALNDDLELWRFPEAGGLQTETFSLFGTGATLDAPIAVDDKYVYTVVDGELRVHHRGPLDVADSLTLSAQGIAADDERLVVTLGAADAVSIRGTGTGPRWWARVDARDQGTDPRRQFIPVNAT